MKVFDQKINLNRIKVVVLGDAGVGKTSLIRTFKEGVFREEWEAGEEVETKLVDHSEVKVLYQMVELHLDDYQTPLPDYAKNARAVLLLYEDEAKETIDTVKNKWYSLVNLHFSDIPLLIVRSKADAVSAAVSSGGRRLAEELHAHSFVECSAKKKRYVNHVFAEVAAILRRQETRKKIEIFNDPAAAPTRLGCWAGMVYNSGPLLKTAFRNAREIISNPLSFTQQKRSIEYYCPILNFNLPAETEEAKEETAGETKEGFKEEKKGQKKSSKEAAEKDKEDEASHEK